MVCLVFGLAMTAHAATHTFTNDTDWNLGTYASTNSGPPGSDDQIQIDPNVLTQFNYIWVALSGRDSVVRIDTDFQDPVNKRVTLAESAAGAGAVFGEYLTRPNGMQGNPSRTTVDQNGDVWVGNRNESSGSQGSVAKILANPTGVTSSGIWDGASTFNRLAWANGGGVDNNGGTSTADDSANEYYVRTAGTGVRTIAVDAANDVWVGGYGNKLHQKIDGMTGLNTGSVKNLSPGGYGGLIDSNGVLWSSGWSSHTIARYDPVTDTHTNIATGGPSYGLAVDSQGNIWNTHYGNNTISKISSAGALLGTWTTGGASNDRGVAVTTVDDNVWVANSGGNNVSRLDNSGNILAVITVENTPTGVSVDKNGKVWVTNYNSNSVSRIDPNTNLVDLTVELGANANPYNYSDMTGTIATGTTNPTGTWRHVLDIGAASNQEWDQVFWNTEAEGGIPAGTSITIEARAADTIADLNLESYDSFLSGDMLNLSGRYMEVRATLTRTGNLPGDPSPILSDLSFTTIPEPATLTLLALGGLALLRKRRKQ